MWSKEWCGVVLVAVAAAEDDATDADATDADETETTTVAAAVVTDADIVEVASSLLCAASPLDVVIASSE